MDENVIWFALGPEFKALKAAQTGQRTIPKKLVKRFLLQCVLKQPSDSSVNPFTALGIKAMRFPQSAEKLSFSYVGFLCSDPEPLKAKLSDAGIVESGKSKQSSLRSC
jgi:hypothetical protein